MKEYIKNFIFFVVLSVVAAIAFRLAFPKTIDVRVIGNISTITGVSGAVNANVSGLVNAKVSGSVETETKVKL